MWEYRGECDKPETTQELILITRLNEDEVLTRQVLPVRFVPLTGGH